MTPDEKRVLRDLREHRAELVGGFLAALPDARAAVLARLWGGLHREGVVDATRLQKPEHPLMYGPPLSMVTADGAGYDHPVGLIEALRPGPHTGRLAAELDNSVANLALAYAANRHTPGHRAVNGRTGFRPAPGDAAAADIAGLADRRAAGMADMAAMRAAGVTDGAADGPAGWPAGGGNAPHSNHAGRGDTAAQGDIGGRAAIGARLHDDLVDVEQSLLDGHPLHPCCRTRLGMSTLDVLAYAPEHHPVVNLRLVAVDPSRWHTTGRAVRPLLPVHPWQLQRALDSGLVTDTGRDVPARPLMSLRTLAPLRTPHLHLKTAVDVQMTSAVRTLSEAAIHNGPLASDLVAALAARTDGLGVLREVAAGTVLDGDGRPQRTLGAVWRQAPPPNATVVPLAVLPHRPDLLTRVTFEQIVELLLPPLFDLLHFGVALEAHGQNTLVEFAAGRPARIWYRDLGGLHVHPGRLRRAGVQMPPLIGALPTDDEDELRTKLFAALLSNVLTGLVAALDDPTCWDTVAAVARRAAHGADRSACFAATWPLKATTAMRLADDPLQDLWCAIPNPIH